MSDFLQWLATGVVLALAAYTWARVVWMLRLTRAMWRAYDDGDGDVDAAVARALEIHRTSRWPRWLR
jgi:hypothetical protein